jgi:lipoprotein-releasing system ATP-binding protein
MVNRKTALGGSVGNDINSIAALEIRDVSQSYSQGNEVLDILRGVNLKIMPGEMVGLVGQSGSGKSTLLHLAGLLEKPSSGTIFLYGVDCGELSDLERTRFRSTDIGFIYQFHHLLPEFTATENIMMPQLIAGLNKAEARTRADLLLNMVGLSTRLHHRPSRLSGGEQQRVAVVRSIANVPRVVLADEPTGNLDPKTSMSVFDQLQEIMRASKIAMLIATHNIELAGKMDRVVSMDKGKIVEL